MRLERFLEAGVDRLEARAGVEAEAGEDLGRDVDLGVAQPVRRESARDRDRRLDVVLGPAKEPAHLGVEREEALRVSHRARAAESKAARSAKG